MKSRGERCLSQSPLTSQQYKRGDEKSFLFQRPQKRAKLGRSRRRVQLGGGSMRSSTFDNARLSMLNCEYERTTITTTKKEEKEKRKNESEFNFGKEAGARNNINNNVFYIHYVNRKNQYHIQHETYTFLFFLFLFFFTLVLCSRCIK